jgi:hypothetical protein
MVSSVISVISVVSVISVNSAFFDISAAVALPKAEAAGVLISGFCPAQGRKLWVWGSPQMRRRLMGRAMESPPMSNMYF